MTQEGPVASLARSAQSAGRAGEWRARGAAAEVAIAARELALAAAVWESVWTSCVELLSLQPNLPGTLRLERRRRMRRGRMLRMDRFHPNQRWIALARAGCLSCWWPAVRISRCRRRIRSCRLIVCRHRRRGRSRREPRRRIIPVTRFLRHKLLRLLRLWLLRHRRDSLRRGVRRLLRWRRRAWHLQPHRRLGLRTERSVAIPADNADLRFAVPPPPTVPPGPAPNSAPQIAAAAAPAVVPAAYNQAVASQPAAAAGLVPAAAVPSATENIDTNSPWRSPAVPNAGSPVMQAQYVQPQPLQPVQPYQSPASSGPQMPVQLRAVPAPPTTQALTSPQPATMVPVAPATTPPPRMRFPSMTDPTTWFTPQPAAAGPPPGQQLVGYMVPGPNGAMQMVSVEQMQAMYGGAAQPAPEVASSDGFRARGSATK